MNAILDILGGMYASVGPGILLALALPVLAGVMGAVLIQSFKRIRRVLTEVRGIE